MKALKRIIALLIIFATLTACLASCGKKTPSVGYTEDTSTEKKDYYYVAMVVEDHGTIIVKLDAVYAPKTTANFIKLVREGFYNGLTFHRVIENFMIQGGDPKADGTGGSSEKIEGEFIANGVFNPIEFKRGTIAMARSSASMDSASSQFFICNSSSTSVSYLYGQYAAFGEVVEGIEVVDSITAATAVYGDSNGTIANKRKQAVITMMMVIEYEETK